MVRILPSSRVKGRHENAAEGTVFHYRAPTCAYARALSRSRLDCQERLFGDKSHVQYPQLVQCGGGGHCEYIGAQYQSLTTGEVAIE